MRSRNTSGERAVDELVELLLRQLPVAERHVPVELEPRPQRRALPFASCRLTCAASRCMRSSPAACIDEAPALEQREVVEQLVELLSVAARPCRPAC
jgi:hypothetical protein